MPTRFFLNALRPHQGGLPAPDKGLWHRDGEFLTRYAGDVRIDGDLEIDSVGHSAPSVFQRPFQFLHALKEPANPLHKAVESEWRGMMALVMLGRWLNVNLTAAPFVVPPVSPTESSYVGNETMGNLHFRAMLRNQLPYRKIEGESNQLNLPEQRVTDWESWSVIRCGSKLIGATSPWTMVYTASKYTAPASVRWQRNGLLIDPIIHFRSLKNGPAKPVELGILYALITEILKGRAAWGFPNELSAFSNLYSNLLTAWQTELAPYADARLVLGPTRSLFSDAPYSGSLRSVGDLDRNDSDLYMDTKMGRVLVFSDKTAPDTRVYRGTFAGQIDIASLPAFGESFKTRDGREVEKPFVVVEKAFFPRKLIGELSLSNNAFLAKDSPPLSTPLTPAFFQYFDHKDLSWLATSESGKDVTATLTLPLLGGGTAVAEQKYIEKDIVVLQLKTPGVAIWPDLYDAKWRGGFASYADGGKDSDDLAVTPIFQSGIQLPAAERAEIGKNQQGVRIWQCEHEPAIGFSLEWRPIGSTQQAVPAGLILLKTLKPMVELGPKTARIGVDFGTSSTTVMMSLGDTDPPKELNFGGRLISLTEHNFGRTTEIERNLYPSAEVKPPFRTLLFEAKAKQFGKQTTPYTVRFATDLKNDHTNAPIADLKWGAQAGHGGSNPLTAYLNGLIRYIVWECLARGIQNIQLSWSYPTSLPKGQLSIMRSFWRSVELPNKYRDGLTIRVMPEMSESEAAGRALAAGPARLRTGSLTIAVDIGGGSTDIAYWSDYTLRDQVSFKLAGNDILDKRFLTDQVMSAIFEAIAKTSPTAEEMESIRERPEIYLNDLLAEAQTGDDPRQHPLCDYISNKAKGNVSPWKDFRSMIYIYFTGLCYYMGTHSRLLKVDKPEIQVYFGGRGASMLGWFSNDPQQIRAVLEYAFRLGLNRPSDDKVPNAFPVVQSVSIDFDGQAISHDARLPKLKTEVAKGLLLATGLELHTALEAEEADGQKRDGAVSAGETGWKMKNNGGADSAPLEWTSKILPDQLANLKAPAESSFESTMIGHFRFAVLEEDKKGYQSTHNLHSDLLKSLKVKGGDVEDLIKRSAEGKDKVTQPIFAYELKALMSQYAEEVTGNGAPRA